MEAFRFLMRLATLALMLYTMLVVLRILLTWLRGADLGRAEVLLGRLTDPYLQWFGRFGWLRIGGMDFSPVFALIVLSVASSITSQLSVTAEVSLGWILAVLAARVGGAIGFFLTLFLVLAAIRLVGLVAGANSAGRFWITLDRLVEPIVHRVMALIAGNRVITYPAALLVFCAITAVVMVGGRFLLGLLVDLLQAMPL